MFTTSECSLSTYLYFLWGRGEFIADNLTLHLPLLLSKCDNGVRRTFTLALWPLEEAWHLTSSDGSAAGGLESWGAGQRVCDSTTAFTLQGEREIQLLWSIVLLNGVSAFFKLLSSLCLIAYQNR